MRNITDRSISRGLLGMGTMLVLCLFVSVEVQAFEPTDLSGCQLWLNANAGVFFDQAGTTPATDGAAVQRWEDQSGNAKHLISVGTSDNAILRSSVSDIKNQTAVEFGATVNGVLKASGNETLGITNDMTVFIVGQSSNPSGNENFFGSIGTAQGWYFYHSGTDYKMILRATGGWTTDYVILSGLTSDWFFSTGQRSGTTTSLARNGGAFINDSGSAGPISYINATLQLGSFDGQIAEVIVYDRALTSEERAQVVYYLRDMYFFSLSSTPPIAYWKLDEANGTALADSAADSLYPVTLNGATPLATVGSTDVPAGMPAGSKSIVFNGDGRTGEYATRAYAATLCGSTFSVAAWIKPYDSTPDLNQEFILGPLDTSITAGWSMRWENGPHFSQQIGTTPPGWTEVDSLNHTTGQWHHVVFQIEDNGATDNYRIYVNGALEKELLAGPNYQPSTMAPFVLGGRSAYTRWDGGLDDVQYYDYTLTALDVQYLYNHPGEYFPPPPPKGTIIIIR